MSLDFLNEAFNRLRKLEEDAFDMSDVGIHELGDFKATDDSADFTQVIDPEAKTEDELGTAYVDRVILECPICHTNIFRIKDEVVIDNEQGLANIDETCPFCGEDGGFYIIGQVEKFKTEDTKKVPAEEINSVEVPVEAEPENEIEVEESYKPFTKRKSIIKESLEDLESKISHELTKRGFDMSSEDGRNYIKAAAEYIQQARDLGDSYTVIEWVRDTLQNYPEDLEQFKESLNTKIENKSLEEAVENINIDMQNDAVSVETGTNTIRVEDGKTIIEDKPTEDEEIIVPLEDEVKDELKQDEDSLKTSEEDKDLEIEDAEDVSEEADEIDETDEDETDEDVDDMEKVDLDIDEIKEENFNILGNKFLKTIYENVQNFETISASTKGEQLKLEGIITFKSGRKKNTSFIFEAKDISKTGKVRFLGENNQLCSGKRPFMISGSLQDKTYIIESMNYNFTTKNANGESTKVRGTVSVKKEGI